MTKRKYDLTLKKLENRFKEKRGTGSGSEYIPWVNIHDFPSNGRSSRLLGIKTNRVHHFLSDLEESFFYLCEWDDRIIDIREKFPLDRTVTFELAEKFNINHPMTTDKALNVITVDFLLTYKSTSSLGGKLVAVDVIPSKQLDKRSVIELIELKRRYWSSENTPYYIFTEKEINKVVVENIKWIHQFYNYITPDTFQVFEPAIDDLLIWLNNETLIISDLLESIDLNYGFDNGTALSIFKSMLCHKSILFDLTKKVSMKENCSFFEVINNDREVSNL